MFSCTSLSLPADAGIRRESRRPPEFRQQGFDEEFDASTLFYDAFLYENVHGANLILLGPPLWNLAPMLLQAKIGSRSLGCTTANLFLRDRCCDIWIPNWRSATARIEFDFATFAFSAQAADSATYRDKRVLYTLSRDNEICWIVDWARFHARNHGADAVLIYDNASTKYSAASLESSLRQALPGLEINVVDWPYPYGPGGFSGDSWWDSDFCQAGAFQHARFRFLDRAASVLNCDIDELVISPEGQSIFEETEKRASGCTLFSGRWIASATVPSRVSQHGSRAVQHGDFRFLERSRLNRCPNKWCVVPGRCRPEDQWITHAVKGKDPVSSSSRAFSYRHFRSISTDWKYPRAGQTSLDPRLHQFDSALDRALVRAGL